MVAADGELTMTYKYRIYSHNFISDVDLGFSQTEFEHCDYRIELGEVQDEGREVAGIVKTSLKDSIFRHDIVGIVTFIVDPDNGIVIHPQREDYYLNEIKLHLLGSVLDMMFKANGYFSLHGSCLRWLEKSMVVCGGSGAGKSTLAFGILDQGAKLISDDVVIHSRQGMTYPGYPLQKLWKDAIIEYDIPYKESDRIFYRDNKYYVKCEEKMYDEPSQLDYMFFLKKDDVQEVSLRRVQGAEAMSVFLSNIYRPETIQYMGMQAEHFQMAAKLVSKLKIYIITRPEVGYTVERQVELINKMIGSVE